MAVKWKALITALLTSLALTSPVAFALQNYSLLFSGVKVFYVQGTSQQDCVLLKTTSKVAWAKEIPNVNGQNFNFVFDQGIYKLCMS